MTSLLYYSYSNGLNEDELIETNKEVDKNRKLVYIFGRELPSNAKYKTKRVILVIALISGFLFSNLKPVEAIGLNIIPTPVVKLKSSYECEHQFNVRIGEIIEKLNHRIAYKSNREILSLISLTDPRVSSNEQVLKIVNELRGGILGSTAFFWINLCSFIFSTKTFLFSTRFYTNHFLKNGSKFKKIKN